MNRKMLILLLALVSTGSVFANLITNPGFESGDFTGWTIDSTNPPPVVSNATANSGTFSALLGTPTGPEPLGDGSFYQTLLSLPANEFLTFSYNGATTDTVTFDWQEVTIRDTTGNILGTVFHQAVNTPGWVPVSYDLSPFAGQDIRVEFLVHQDGFGDDTNMYVDDVNVSAAVPEPATLALAGAGLMLLGVIGRRRRKQS